MYSVSLKTEVNRSQKQIKIAIRDNLLTILYREARRRPLEAPKIINQVFFVVDQKPITDSFQ